LFGERESTLSCFFSFWHYPPRTVAQCSILPTDYFFPPFFNPPPLPPLFLYFLFSFPFFPPILGLPISEFSCARFFLTVRIFSFRFFFLPLGVHPLRPRLLSPPPSLCFYPPEFILDNFLNFFFTFAYPTDPLNPSFPPLRCSLFLSPPPRIYIQTNAMPTMTIFDSNLLFTTALPPTPPPATRETYNASSLPKFPDFLFECYRISIISF